MVLESSLKRAYISGFDLEYSPCGNYLAVCDNFGVISIFRLSDALAADAKLENYKPTHAIQAAPECIYSLCSHDDVLIAAGYNQIQAWEWDTIISNRRRLSWSLNLSKRDSSEVEANSLAIDTEEKILYAGCGDSLIHAWDLTTGIQKAEFSGHTDVVQGIKLENSQLTSISEDGTVRIWDVRTSGGQSQHVMTPSKDDKVARPKIGSWLTALAVNADLIACGGGPKLGLWSLRTLSNLTVMECKASTCHTAMFLDDMLVTGGTGSVMYHWNLNGDMRAKVPIQSATIYSIQLNENSRKNKVLTVSGSSPFIDVCINYNYSSFKLSM